MRRSPLMEQSATLALKAGARDAGRLSQRGIASQQIVALPHRHFILAYCRIFAQPGGKRIAEPAFENRNRNVISVERCPIDHSGMKAINGTLSVSGRIISTEGSVPWRLQSSASFS